ncbi:MAG: hypothetical protein R3D05_17875 [Dongiaceae bacterium]
MMDTIGEAAIRAAGFILRAIAEFLLEHVLELVLRPVGRAYFELAGLVGRIVRIEFLAIPTTILLLMAIAVGALTATITLIQIIM